MEDTKKVEKVEAKKVEPKKKGKGFFSNEKAGFYKNYDINWLRNEPEHPDFKLVAEYDALKEKKDK